MKKRANTVPDTVHTFDICIRKFAFKTIMHIYKYFYNAEYRLELNICSYRQSRMYFPNSVTNHRSDFFSYARVRRFGRFCETFAQNGAVFFFFKRYFVSLEVLN